MDTTQRVLYEQHLVGAARRLRFAATILYDCQRYLAGDRLMELHGELLVEAERSLASKPARPIRSQSRGAGA